MVHTILHFTAGLNAEIIVILESSSGGTAVAVNKTDDTVFVKVSPPRGWNLKGGEGWGKFKLFTKENKSKYGLRKTTKTNLKIRFRSSSTKKTHPNRQKKPKAFMKLFPPSFPPPSSTPNHFSDSPSSDENCASSMNIQAPNPLGLEPSITFHSYRNDLVFLSFGNIWKSQEITLIHNRLKFI